MNEATFTALIASCLLGIIAIRIIWCVVGRKKPTCLSTGERPPFYKLDIALALFLLVFFFIRPILGANSIPKYDLFLLMLIFPVYLRFLILDNHIEKPSIPFSKNMSCILVVLIVTYLFNNLIIFSGLNQYLQTMFGANPLQNSVLALKTSPLKETYPIVVSSIIIAPFIEEIFFRGYLYPFIKEYSSPLFSAITISLLFGIIHMSIIHILPLAVFGFLLTYAYEKTKNIWVPITTHCIFNSITVFYTLFSR